MRVIIRTIIVLAILWIGLLLTGYGVLVGSTENAAGLGIQCKYVTAQGVSTAQYLHSDSGIIRLTNCPVLRKMSVVVDNG
ncbi:YobH family protein [Enterobacter kobei]